jgi:formylglycine-generating enzyme required for sulfatase activity
MRKIIAVCLLLSLVVGCDQSDIIVCPQPEVTGELVMISAGSFMMGSPENELGHLGEEGLHSVTLTNDFYIYSTEVTNQEYADMAQLALENGYCQVTDNRLWDLLDGSTLELLDMFDDDCEISFIDGNFIPDDGAENRPVIEVTWHGAASFCDWKSMLEGLPRAYNHTDPTNWAIEPYATTGYRLPTEAEWEYACRAGSEVAYTGGQITEIGCGDEPSLSNMGWYCGNADVRLHNVGELNANAYGLFDMHGNIWEWTNDWYHTEYPETEVNPEASSVDAHYKVLRGGAWSEVARRCRSASRRNPSPHKSVEENGRHGFRYCIGM